MPRKKRSGLSVEVLHRLIPPAPAPGGLDDYSLRGWLKVSEAIQLCRLSDRQFRRRLRNGDYRSREDLDVLRVWWKDVPVLLDADELGAPE